MPRRFRNRSGSACNRAGCSARRLRRAGDRYRAPRRCVCHATLVQGDRQSSSSLIIHTAATRSYRALRFRIRRGHPLEQRQERKNEKRNHMNNLTIVTKLRFMAAIAPAILLITAVVIAAAMHAFGALPRDIHENEYAAARAAQGMETSLDKMDWGRTQPDASQIVIDQQRGFISEIEIARQHIGSREQAESIEKIANEARPLFDAMRTASPSDDSLEPKLRDLQGTVADLMSLDDAALIAVANSAESQARLMIAITIV